MTRPAALLLFILALASGTCAENVALSSSGAIAIADSEYGNQGAANAIDGKWVGPSDAPDDNRWHAALGKDHPHWVWVKFREPAEITRVIVRRTDLSGYPVDFVGEYSPDGGLTFRTLFSVTGNRMDEGRSTIDTSFAPVVTDNFRLRIEKSSNAEHPDYAQISELEVHGEFIGVPAKQKPAMPSRFPDRVLKTTNLAGLTVTETDGQVEFRSKWLRLAFSKGSPRIASLCWDSLGEGKLDANLLKPEGAGLSFVPFFPDAGNPDAEFEREGNVVHYRVLYPDGIGALWEIRVAEKAVRMSVVWSLPSRIAFSRPLGLRFAFDCGQTPVAPLANPRPGMTAPLPCIVHAPDYGSLLVRQESGKGAYLEGESQRPQAQWNATIAMLGDKRDDGVYVVDPAKSRSEILLSVEADTYPRLLASDPKLRFMPRTWLNCLQYRPDVGILSNNIVSDNCSFCTYEYADLAAFTPPLPGGIDAIEVVRGSLDRYFAGARGYGVGWEDIMVDTFPSHLIAAWDVVRVTGDMALLERWLPHLEKIAARVESQDRNGNGLPESTKPGTRGEIHCPTSNWWDQINFGHEDAYACALAYRAFRCLADLERLAKKPEMSARFDKDADRLRDAYLPAFLNPKTGVIAGWKDADGDLHDYWFVMVNGIAIAYGLVPSDQANRIVDRIEAKMRVVGFNRFDLGLPGPLVPVPKNDYGLGALGSPQKDDGTDAFGVFENGGASACMAYFYIQALYQLGRREEGDRILYAMAKTYADGKFQNGVGHGGEWTRWDGRPSGYEGYLTDAYYTQLAYITGHYGITLGPDGFEVAPWSPLDGRRIPLGLRYMGKVTRDIR